MFHNELNMTWIRFRRYMTTFSAKTVVKLEERFCVIVVGSPYYSIKGAFYL